MGTDRPDGDDKLPHEQASAAEFGQLADVPEPAAVLATRERYVRGDADRLDAAAIQRIASRRTGATAAAFFDLDKTIIARSSVAAMGRTFFRDGLISPSTLIRGMYAQAIYQLVGADHDRMEQMRAAMLDLTRGWDVARVRRLVEETVEDVILPLVHAEALELFAVHRAAGRDVWIVSSSGEEIVEPFGRALGVRDVIASRGGVDDEGCYDGTLSFYAYGAAKATAMHQIALARGYDLDASYAYSDSITDLPMLSAVGHPVAVNPDRDLRAAAAAMGWERLDFRSPVATRQRLPELPERAPSAGVLATGAAILAGGLLAWRALGGRD